MLSLGPLSRPAVTLAFKSKGGCHLMHGQWAEKHKAERGRKPDGFWAKMQGSHLVQVVIIIIIILQIVHVFREWVWNSPSLRRNFCLVWICSGFHKLSQSVWGHICISPVVSRRYCTLGVVHHLWLFQSVCLLFHIDPWTLREGVW